MAASKLYKPQLCNTGFIFDSHLGLNIYIDTIRIHMHIVHICTHFTYSGQTRNQALFDLPTTPLFPVCCSRNSSSSQRPAPRRVKFLMVAADGAPTTSQFIPHALLLSGFSPHFALHLRVFYCNYFTFITFLFGFFAAMHFFTPCFYFYSSLTVTTNLTFDSNAK